MKIKEERLIDAISVRKVCIAENYYTRGTNEEYENLFSKLEGYDYFVIKRKPLPIYQKNALEKMYKQYTEEAHRNGVPHDFLDIYAPMLALARRRR